MRTKGGHAFSCASSTLYDSKFFCPFLIPIYGSLIKVIYLNHFINTLHIATKFYSEHYSGFFNALKWEKVNPLKKNQHCTLISIPLFKNGGCRLNVQETKEANDEAESHLLAKLTGEIIYTLSNRSCSEWTAVMGALQCLDCNNHAPLGTCRFKSAVQTPQLSSL